MIYDSVEVLNVFIMYIKKNKLILFFFLCLTLGCLFFFIKRFEFERDSNNVPLLTDEESALFSKMWGTLYFDANFGYTLLGSKPVSIGTWRKSHLQIPPNPFVFYIDGRTKECWELFSEMHPSTHYALLFTEIFSSDLDPCGEVIFINKAQVKSCFEQYKHLFTKTLYFPDFSAETIALQILKSRNHELIGIILGFGPYNSKYFQRSYDLKAYYEHARYFPKHISLIKEDLSLLKGSKWTSIINSINLSPEEVMKELKERSLANDYGALQSFYEENPLSPVPLPTFMIKKEYPETDELIEIYQKEQKKVVELGFSKPLLDPILSIYFNGAPCE